VRAGQTDAAPAVSTNGRVRPDLAFERRLEEELAQFDG